MEISWVLNYNAALITNIFAILILWRKYGVVSLLHPFNYYLITWIISLLSFSVAISVGLGSFLIYDIKLLSLLFFTVAFVGGVICLVLLGSKKPVVLETFDWDIPENLLKTVGFFILLIGLFLIVSNGFDVASNRLSDLGVGLDAAASGQRTGFLGALFGLFLTLKLPLLIYNGNQFYSMVITKTEKLKYYIFFVLVGSLLEVISVGGRSGIVTSCTYFFVGILLIHVRSTKNISNWFFLKKLVLIIIIPLILVSSYINFVAEARINRSGSSNVTKKLLSRSYFGEKFSGIMEYSIFHIVGYQYRMKDKVSDELEMGRYTFQFITTYNLPVVSQIIGSEINLASVLNLKKVDSNLANIKSKSNNTIHPGITATVFLVLYDDFGFNGSLIVLLFFIILTNRTFNKFLSNDINNFFSIIIWLFIFDLWKMTWFSHHLNGPIFNPYLYSAILLSLTYKMFKSK